MEKKLSLKAYAKINLALDVLSKREDSYHELKMLMQTIDIYDTLHFKLLAEDKIILNLGLVFENKEENLDKGLFDKNNIVYKAARLIKDRYNIKEGIEINIDKNIPIAAGLAGGSTDAAATLKALNHLFNLNLNIDTLKALALELGADVPYCLLGSTYLATGIGEKLTKLKSLKDFDIVLVKPDFNISTKEVFEALKFDKKLEALRPDIEKMCKHIDNNDIEGMAGEMKNVLELYTADKYKEVSILEDIMKKNRALNAIMSGSGPSVFGIFKNKEDAFYCYSRLKEDRYKNLVKHIYLTKMI